MAGQEILKRVMKTQTVDTLHTSAYAGVQNAGNFGAASTESFAMRRSIDERRKFVRGYHNSKIISGSVMTPRAKTYTPPERTTGVLGGSATDGTGRSAGTKVDGTMARRTLGGAAIAPKSGVGAISSTPKPADFAPVRPAIKLSRG